MKPPNFLKVLLGKRPLRPHVIQPRAPRQASAGALLGFVLISMWPALVRAQFAYWPSSAGGNGHYYEAVASPGINWFDANAMAFLKGGNLVTITSPEENDLVYGMIRTNAALWDQRSTGNSWGPWIGGFQLPGSIEPAGGWSWVTGEPFAYANWNVGEPSNNHDLENRIDSWGAGAAVGDVWNDKPASDLVRGFVIEYSVHPNAVRLSITLHSPGELELSWSSKAEVGYTVQWSPGFAGSNWINLTNVLESGGVCSVLDRSSNPQRLYRVLSTP